MYHKLLNSFKLIALHNFLNFYSFYQNINSFISIFYIAKTWFTDFFSFILKKISFYFLQKDIKYIFTIFSLFCFSFVSRLYLSYLIFSNKALKIRWVSLSYFFNFFLHKSFFCNLISFFVFFYLLIILYLDARSSYFTWISLSDFEDMKSLTFSYMMIPDFQLVDGKLRIKKYLNNKNLLGFEIFLLWNFFCLRNLFPFYNQSFFIFLNITFRVSHLLWYLYIINTLDLPFYFYL